jgi:hypothetical protein
MRNQIVTFAVRSLIPFWGATRDPFSVILVGYGDDWQLNKATTAMKAAALQETHQRERVVHFGELALQITFMQPRLLSLLIIDVSVVTMRS